MTELELLAPAKNIEIGIAAIDCGADAVYIAGPAFGARKAAGNSMEDIGKLCAYAHRFGCRIFLTLNTILYDDELEDAYRTMLAAEDAGVDAIIVQDMAVLTLADGGPDGTGRKLGIPLHASTQCAVRDAGKAARLESMGFSRLVLEREMSLDGIREIRSATGCELEFFVHGALCVCYSGQCYMSESICGRSANRGDCIQACRSLYDLVDDSGNVLVRNKALLSLKDYNLLHRLGDLAVAGACSFKIEGRLKNESYVRNVVRAYSEALDSLVSSHPEKYVRASFGRVSGGFIPDVNKTFNRGYTELYLDGRRGQWSSMDAPKGMGEQIGRISKITRHGSDLLLTINPSAQGLRLANGDGFSAIGKDGVIRGFRGDVCSGLSIQCKYQDGLQAGNRIFRNLSVEFEKQIESHPCSRKIEVAVDIQICGSGAAVRMDDVAQTGADSSILDNRASYRLHATTEDGREVSLIFGEGKEPARDRDRMLAVVKAQLSKSSGDYSFSVSGTACSGSASVGKDEAQSQLPHTQTNSFGPSEAAVPFVSTAEINEARRSLAAALDMIPVNTRTLRHSHISIPDSVFVEKDGTGQEAQPQTSYKDNISNRLSSRICQGLLGTNRCEPAFELAHQADAELMRTRYCIRYELGMCPKHHHAKSPRALYLLNNGQRFALGFDCARCEMTVRRANGQADR